MFHGSRRVQFLWRVCSQLRIHTFRCVDTEFSKCSVVLFRKALVFSSLLFWIVYNHPCLSGWLEVVHLGFAMELQRLCAFVQLHVIRVCSTTVSMMCWVCVVRFSWVLRVHAHWAPQTRPHLEEVAQMMNTNMEASELHSESSAWESL